MANKTPKKSTKRATKELAAKSKAPAKSSKANKSKSQTGSVKLLSGGNPQIPNGYGNGPVQDYIAAMPDWKREA
jgi:hypothetical protein